MVRPSIAAGGSRRLLVRRARVVVWLLLVLAGVFLLAEATARAQAPSVLVVTVDGVITPVMSDHVRDALDRAEREGFQALLVQLDTPGGLDTSMREIVQAFLNARVPVIVYVSPQGARAASAGAIITLASHVAAMAPGTSIGAATPIDLEGGDLAQKIINDAASYAESIADRRGRNVEFAIDAVREGRSASASEALELGVVELVAGERAELLATLDGRSVELTPGNVVTLRTEGAELVEAELGLARSILQWLADPNLAFLFISIGTLAILYELANPGIGGGAIVGVILLVLAFTALSVFPVNAAGVILLVLAAALFIAELFAPGIGVFAAGGTVALVLGGLFLFRGPIGVDPAVMLPTAIVAGAAALALGRMAWRTRKLAGVSGTDAIVGSRGVVQRIENGEAHVFLQGSWWGARARSGPLRPGQEVRVVGMDGLRLIVEAEDDPGGHPTGPDRGARPIEGGER
ncbi:MAG: serine protease [Actinomycetota bacterium]|jgi:membrane-bound serine protease (ClpP class)|nr:MAG: serine protease [Actinomycetota bacterium]